MRRNNKANYCIGIICILTVSVFILSIIFQPVFSYHGKEILLNPNDGQFLSLPSKDLQQIKLTVIYSVSDSATVGKQVSAIMKVYAQNGSVIKTTSIPNGFYVEESGFQQFVTSLPNSTIQSVTTTVVFTELNKTSPLSNSLTTELNLNKTQ